MLACDAKIGIFCEIERCDMLAIRTPAAVWPAMRGACDAKSLAMWVERCENCCEKCLATKFGPFFISEELKKAVAVSEEKIQQRSEGAANFPAAVFPGGKGPNLGRDSISCCRKNRGRIFQQHRNLPENLSARNLGQPQPSRVF